MRSPTATSSISFLRCPRSAGPGGSSPSWPSAPRSSSSPPCGQTGTVRRPDPSHALHETHLDRPSRSRSSPPRIMAGFAAVLLRGLALSGQAVAIGGVLFAIVVLRPATRARPALVPLLGRSRRLIAVGAGVAAVAQALSLTTQLSQLADERGWPFWQILSTGYFEASLIRIGACLGLIIACA